MKEFSAKLKESILCPTGDMVYIQRYVDDEWMLGESGERRGLVPTSYVNVIVDIVASQQPQAPPPPPPADNDPYGKDLKAISAANRSSSSSTPTARPNFESNEFWKTSAVTVHANLTLDTFHKVLYTFQVNKLDSFVTTEVQHLGAVVCLYTI